MRSVYERFDRKLTRNRLKWGNPTLLDHILLEVLQRARWILNKLDDS